jgi:ppGpp synthetase/RelA/SpoT-type nucleotidyltranferase
MQDIAGCRLVVDGSAEQDWIVESGRESEWDGVRIEDRRSNPSHGYRAVHVILTVSDRMVEVQVRTALQHAWAELSEKLSDLVDPAIKYGGGDQLIRSLLNEYSTLIARTGALEASSEEPELPSELSSLKQQIAENLRHIADVFGE